jgi:ribosomal protein S18 acetylase RimI-like enzyme
LIAAVTIAAPTFEIPPPLRAQGLRLRAQTESDGEAAAICLAAARWEELSATGWSDDQKWSFLAQQSDAQQKHYGTYYADGEFALIECEGELAGRLYLFRSKTDVRVIDITLLPKARGRGIGAELLRALQHEAEAQGRTVSINVERQNPARRLYQRLGFVEDEAESNGVYLRMDWRPT